MDHPHHIGPYRVTAELGLGGMGRVYQGVDEAGAVVAVKAVEVPNRAALAAIRREIAALARVRVPGVVRIRDHGVHEGLPWYAMDHVDGLPLTEWASGRSLAEKLAVMAELVATLASVHGLGIVHRDLKSENVLVSGDRPVLVDFGVSTRGHAVRSPGSVLPTGEGTVGYMAPEQLLGQEVDARTDLYALGVLLHEVVGGRHPHAESSLPLAFAALRATPSPLRQHAPDAPRALEELVAELLAVRTQDRPAYAAEVLDRLNAIRGERTDRPPLPTYLYPASFLGRDAELATLTQALRGLPDLQGGLALVGGQSGSGKSRLVAELAAVARERGYEVIHGSCRPGGGVLHPWKPVLRRLGDLALEGGVVAEARLLEHHGPVLAAFEPLLGDLPGVRGQGQAAHLREDLARLRLLDALATTLGNLAGCWPGLLVVLDDLQWADEATLALLAQLGDGVDDPVLVVGSYRSEHEERLREAVGESPLVSVQLDPLDASAVQAMVRQMLALPEGGDPVVDRLVERCGGSPFFVAELLRAGVEQGTLVRENGRWVLSVDAADQLPRSARDAIVGRLDRCGPDAQAVVAAVSVLQKGSSVAVLRAICPLDDAAFERALGELSVRHLLADEVSAPRFVHDQQQEAAYARLTDDRRVALHELAADRLESDAESPAVLGELARHALAAGQRSRARAALIEATRRAAGEHSGLEAISLGDQAIALEEGEPDLSWVEHRYVLGSLVGRLGQFERSVELTKEAVEMTETAGGQGMVAALWARVGLMATRSGRAEDAKHALAQAEATLGESEGIWRYEALRQLGTMARERGDFALAIALLGEARERPENTRGQRASLTGNLALATGALGRTEEALALHRQTLAEGEAVDNPSLMGAACGALAAEAYHQGQLDEARSLFRKAAAHHKRAYHRALEMAWLTNLADLERARGALDEARRLLQEVLVWHQSANNVAGHAICEANLGVVEFESGNAHLGLDILEQAVARVELTGRAAVIGQVQMEMGRAALFAGEFERAERAIRDAIRTLDGIGAATHLAGARAVLGHVKVATGRDPWAELAALERAIEALGASSESQLGQARARLQRAMDTDLRVAGYAVEDVPEAWRP